LRLCFGTYAKVLLRCRRTGVTQVELGREMLLSVNGNVSVHYSDSSISDLVNGRKNLGHSDVECARYGSIAEIAGRFHNEMEPLLDENMVSLAVAAVRELILGDKDIGLLTTVDRLCELSKADLERTSCYEPWSFLAGILIFVASGVKNRGTEQDCVSVEGLFTEDLDVMAASLTLVDALDRESSHLCRVWADGPSSLDVMKGDLFELVGRGGKVSSKAIAVVPVDSDFSTEISRRLEELDEHGVSEKTIHGKWLLRLMSDGLSKAELDRRISDVLSKQGLMEGQTSIGSVSVIDVGATAYYLLAVSRMDQNGNAQSSSGAVKQALVSLVDFYDKHGQGYPLYIPLVGTGLSRARMSARESFEAIRDVFTANRECVHGSVSIVVLPGTWDELGLDDDGKSSEFR